MFFNNEDKGSAEQERKLQLLVDEVMEDVNNKDFDDAYIKAQQIDYTYDWDDQVDEKWDRTRKHVINYIVPAEEKEYGKAIHSREK
ncbi:MAG: hypothetical protein PUB09_02260 [Firmicutes bacterium]|nr:hypothetical protein [Bacillota bacterium]